MKYTNQERLKAPSKRYIYAFWFRPRKYPSQSPQTLFYCFAQVLACDFSFKRKLGDFDERKVVGWDLQLQRRKSRSRMR
jgi:hypothetical protein